MALTPEQVTEAYQRLLGQTPSASGAAQRAGEFESMESLESRLMASPKYQGGAAPATAGTPAAASVLSTGAGEFDIPVEKYPTSTTTSTQANEQRSGIDWNQNPLMQELMTSLVQRVGSMDQDIEKYSKIADDKYKALIRDAVGPQALQGTLEDFGARGMIDTSFKGDAIQGVLTNLIRDITQNAYNTQLDIAGKKIGIPERMAEIAKLGHVSTGTGMSTSATSTTNPLAPYELMANIIMNQ